MDSTYTKIKALTLAALLTSALCWISSSKQSLWPSWEDIYAGVQPYCFSAKAHQSIRASSHQFIHPSIQPAIQPFQYYQNTYMHQHTDNNRKKKSEPFLFTTDNPTELVTDHLVRHMTGLNHLTPFILFFLSFLSPPLPLQTIHSSFSKAHDTQPHT